MQQLQIDMGIRIKIVLTNGFRVISMKVLFAQVELEIMNIYDERKVKKYPIF